MTQAITVERPEMSPEERNEISQKLTALVNSCQKENPSPAQIEALRETMKIMPEIWRQAGDIATLTESEILSDTFKSNFLSYESTQRKLLEMRDDLGWQTANELGRLAIHQVCLTWLNLYISERTLHRTTSNPHSSATGSYWSRQLTGAQRRHLRAIETLAKVNKLAAQTEEIRAKAARILKKLKTRIIETATTESYSREGTIISRKVKQR